MGAAKYKANIRRPVFDEAVYFVGMVRLDKQSDIRISFDMLLEQRNKRIVVDCVYAGDGQRLDIGKRFEILRVLLQRRPLTGDGNKGRAVGGQFNDANPLSTEQKRRA